MIRIDEIYNSVFWPWMKKYRPQMRMFYFYPFGRTDQDSICNYGNNNPDHYLKVTENTIINNNYTLFFDQEPINLGQHQESFACIKNEKNPDINFSWIASQQLKHGDGWWANSELRKEQPNFGILITSEKNSDTVDQVCKEFGWRSAYYFFHGWAALDWYRGYDKTYQMPPPQERKITKTFIAPNRIVGGERKHRLVMLYHIFKYNMLNNWISCPKICPAENIFIEDAIKDLVNIYPDIKEVFNTQQFPIEFPNESGAPMHSYCLSLFQESAESLLYLVTETVATGNRLHLTEKTFKPICLQMPFIIVGTKGSLAYLRSYGFKTFNYLWDESYDDEINDIQRIEKIAFILKSIDVLPEQEKQRLFDMAQEVCEYNYNHFYNGGFESILWKELQDMLNGF